MIEDFLNVNNFNLFGEISNTEHTINRGENRGQTRDCSDYSQESQDYTDQRDMVYLWIKEEDGVKEIIYVGETARTVLERWKNGHGPASKKQQKPRKLQRLFDILSNDQVIVEVWAKRARQEEIMGETVSLRHAEEMAIIQKYNPILNA